MFRWLARLFRPADPAWIQAEELRRRLGMESAPLVLEVRNPDEFDGPLGHIEGARNIPVANLPAHCRELAAAGRPIVCVCLTDKRSAHVAADLAIAGARDVTVLRAGWKRGARLTLRHRRHRYRERAARDLKPGAARFVLSSWRRGAAWPADVR